MDSLISDEELVGRAQRGCQASFEQLLRRFQTPVLHFLRRRGHSMDAEDLAQETFLRAYRSLQQYDCRWAFSTWLFTIARRASINHGRARREPVGSSSVESLAAAAPEPLDAMTAAEGRRRLWDLAAHVLSEEQHTALWLHYAEEMPIAEIGVVLGRTAASVKIMMFRARRKLLPWLGEFETCDRLRPVVGKLGEES